MREREHQYGYRPTVRNRLAARVRSEVPAHELEAFRRAGQAVFDVELLAEERRNELVLRSCHPWEADAATTSLLLCAWNARAHQTLGAELLAADARDDPRTAGFVPPDTHRQVWAFFQPVQGWLSLARRAAANDEFWVGDQVELPTALPALTRPRSAPATYLMGMLTAGDALDRLLEQVLGAVGAAGEVPQRWKAEAQRIDELAAQARAALHYAQGLWHPGCSPELSGAVFDHLFPALVLEHHVGQFLVLPELVKSYRDGRVPARRRKRR
jgi:hypothetical protein